MEHPVMLAGMGGVSYHALVAAVSEAGGIGTFGASTMGPDELPQEIAAAKALTSKPIGWTCSPRCPDRWARHQRRDRRWGGAVRRRPRRAREVIDLLHANNILVGSMCGKVRHAVSAVALGSTS
ncbi:MAG: nitronate monooxygenase [Ilumatobacteraceae bacterium]